MSRPILGALLLASSMSSIAEIDVSGPLICSLGDFSECSSIYCDRVSASEINAPTMLRIDAGKKTIESIQGGAGRTSKVDHSEMIDNRLILLGAEDGVEGRRDGLGYSISVNQQSGNLVFSASSQDVVFTAFGSCIED